VYLYTIATSPQEAREEANFLLNNVLKGKQFELPIYIDIEDERYYSRPKASNSAVVKAFCDTLEAKDYFTGVYASTYFFATYLDDSQLKAYTHWVAQWSTQLTYPDKSVVGMWQFGGSTNRIRSPIIAGFNVDQNYMYKDFPSIIKSYGLNGFGREEAPVMNPVTLPSDVGVIKKGDRNAGVYLLKQNILLLRKAGVITQSVDDNNVYVEMGANQMEGVMLQKDQVPGEKYELNMKIKVFVKRVRNTGKTTQVLVSRASTGLVKRLFENEVPEIRQGLVQIKSVAREAGQRTKIAIYSEDPQIDPIGTCVGPKGVRVNAVVAELGGEKIDIIPWSENPLEFIAKALSPAKVVKVYELDEPNSARAIVPDDKLSLAIGRDGQNARLAVKLTGWKIDVKSESSVASEE
jgi:transcription antitermination factor NusA-like protein